MAAYPEVRKPVVGTPVTTGTAGTVLPTGTVLRSGTEITVAHPAIRVLLRSEILVRF